MTHPSQIAALVPAAGSSSRMGRDKRRLPLEGRTVLETTVARLRDAGLAPLYVVLEADSPCRELRGLEDAHLVVNPRPERGMLSSIRLGLEALPPEIEAVAVQPGDHAFVPTVGLEALFAHYRRHRPLLLVPRYPQVAGEPRRRGHPLIIRRELFAEAAACDDAVGLRELLRRHEDELDILPLDLAGADDDLDTPEDYARRVGRRRDNKT